jgi:hypothetical protein
MEAWNCLKNNFKKELDESPMAMGLGFQYQRGDVMIPSLAITHILLLIWMDAVGMVSWPSSSSNPMQGGTLYLTTPASTKVENMH